MYGDDRDGNAGVIIEFHSTVGGEPGAWRVHTGNEYAKRESWSVMSPECAIDYAIAILSAAKDAKQRQEREPKKAQR